MRDCRIGEAETGDLPAIRDVHDAAFGGSLEGELVQRLTDDGLVIASVVAVDEDGGAILGHVLFSELPLVSAEGITPAAALAPVAVLPACQRQGIGSALIQRGLELCQARSVAAVLVLGNPAYYQRFGFSLELGARVRSPYAGPHFMALELRPGAVVPGCEARYPAAFADLE